MSDNMYYVNCRIGAHKKWPGIQGFLGGQQHPHLIHATPRRRDRQRGLRRCARRQPKRYPAGVAKNTVSNLQVGRGAVCPDYEGWVLGDR